MRSPEWQRVRVVFLLGLLVLGLAAPATAERRPYRVLHEREAAPGDAPSAIERAAGELEGDFVFDCELADDPDTPEIDGPTADDVWYCPYQWNLHRVNAPGAWRLGATGSHETIVAIVDSGIAESAADLAPNLLIQECFLDEPSGAPCSTTFPREDHGTGVASIVAAAFGGGPPISGTPDAPRPRTFGGGPMVGVGPHLGLASYKVFEPCFGEGCGARFLKALLLSLEDAIAKREAGIPIDVVSMSLDLGIPRDPQGTFWASVRAIERVVDRANRAGIVIVIAAGNDAWNARRVRDLHAGFNLHPGAIIVGGTGYSPDVLLDGNTPVFPTDAFVDTLVSYSNFGSGVDLVAPAGETVCSAAGCALATRLYHGVVHSFLSIDAACIASRSCSPAAAPDRGGTSIAAPHVAAAAALVIDWAKRRGIRLRPQQVKGILTRTAQPLGDRQRFGHGIVDVLAAIREVDAMTRGSGE